MANKGSFKTTAYDSRCLEFSWSIKEQSIANNTTTITWVLKSVGSGEWSKIDAGNFKVTIDGKQVYFSSDRVTTTDGLVIATDDYKFNHNSDGTKSFTAYAEAGIYYYAVNCKGSKTFTLDKIIRSATIVSAPNFTDEDNPTITYSNTAGTIVEKLEACISLDGSSADVPYREISKTGTSYTFNLTDAERDTLRNATSTSDSRTVKFYLRTTIDGKAYLTSVSKKLTIINASPYVFSSLIDTGSVSSSLTGSPSNILIKGYNIVTVYAFPQARKGAGVKSYSVTNGTRIIKDTEECKFGYVEDNKFIVTITDTRNKTYTETLRFRDFVEYIKLTCNLEITGRAVNGEATFKVSGNYFKGSFGATTNSLAVEYCIKQDNGDYGEWQTLTPTISGDTYSLTKKITGLDYKSTYTIKARAKDAIYNADTEPAKESAEIKLNFLPVFDWSKSDFNLNVPLNMNSKQTLRVTDVNKVVLSAEAADIYLRPNGTAVDTAQLRLTTDGQMQYGGKNLHNSMRFPNYSNAIINKTYKASDNGDYSVGVTYTAVQDCCAMGWAMGTATTNATIKINNVIVGYGGHIYPGSVTNYTIIPLQYYLKEGDTINITGATEIGFKVFTMR